MFSENLEKHKFHVLKYSDIEKKGFVGIQFVHNS